MSAFLLWRKVFEVERWSLLERHFALSYPLLYITRYSLLGCLVAWLLGCSVASLLGCVVAWLLGGSVGSLLRCLNAWLLGCLEARLVASLLYSLLRCLDARLARWLNIWELTREEIWSNAATRTSTAMNNDTCQSQSTQNNTVRHRTTVVRCKHNHDGHNDDTVEEVLLGVR